MLLGDQLRPAQIIQGPLDGGAGEVQLGGDRPYSRPAFALTVGVIFQVHIDRSGSVAEVGLVDLFNPPSRKPLVQLAQNGPQRDGIQWHKITSSLFF